MSENEKIILAIIAIAYVYSRMDWLWEQRKVKSERPLGGLINIPEPLKKKGLGGGLFGYQQNKGHIKCLTKAEKKQEKSVSVWKTYLK